MSSFSHIIDEYVPLSLRLDRYISEKLKLLSRSQIKVRELKAKVNGKDVKLSCNVKCGDHLELNWNDCQIVDFIPEDIPLEILYEDDKCIVINKACGMVVHPGAGNNQGTLANALYYRRLKKNSGSITNSTRPGIVHRLDKDTSGIIIAAWNDDTHEFLAAQFKSRKVRKSYIAIVLGMPKEIKGSIETCIARDSKDRKRFTVSAVGKKAVTYYKVIKSWRSYSLLLLRPYTGRTHQLRVHMRYLGCPVLGDPVYGNTDKLFPDAKLMLHSKSLAITLPDETEQRVFSSGIPERFKEVINKLDKNE
jgi:23S rRNA pseudouridine1911/1915/1917 synthase